LIRLLKEASEIEHSLMLQYIYAAFSLKPKYRALVGPPAASSDGLLGIAIQEMQHLAIVNKLLVALGASPNLDRQDFPHEPDIYPFRMSLERLSRSSLARYTYVESGRQSIPMAGDIAPADQLLCDELTAELGTDTGLNQVAGLYGVIIDHLSAMASAGTLALENPEEWIAKLNHIMIDGERYHFEFFRKLFLAKHEVFAGQPNPWKLDPEHADYPSFAVPENPTAYVGHANQIESTEARELAWLSNLHYWIVLMLLDSYYRYGSEALNAMAQGHMAGPLQSLALRLAELRSGLPFDVLSLGYAPSVNYAGNLLLIEHFCEEAHLLAQKLKASLPAGYPAEMSRITVELVRTEREKLARPQRG
jgi:hypothetical protein